MGIWRREIFTFLLLFLVICITGLFTKLFFLLMLALTTIFLGRHLYQLNRFEKWLRTGGYSYYPKTTGVWEEVYYHVYRMKKNNKRRKKKLSKMGCQINDRSRMHRHLVNFCGCTKHKKLHFNTLCEIAA